MRRAARRARRVGQVFAMAWRLATLGERAGRLKIFGVTLLLGARRIIRRAGRRLHRLKIRIGDTVRPVTVSDYGELEVMRDILLDEDYALPGLPPPKLILDIGANIGLAALYFRAQYPRAEIVSVEPDPVTFAKLERNVAGHGRIRVVNVAVADKPGELVLHRPPGYSIASSLKRAAPGDGHVRVRAEPLDRICDELGLGEIDLLKLDVEGAELEVLRGFSRLAAVGAILGEAHPLLLGEQKTGELFRMLDGFQVERLSESEDAISFLARGRRTGST